MTSAGILPSSVDIEASELYVQRLNGEWTPHDQTNLEARLGSDREFADAYGRAEQSWTGLDAHAESPEFMGYREEAMAYARRAGARRWLKPRVGRTRRWRVATAAAVVAVALGVAWQFSPFGYTPGQYRTGIGEQRMVELDDHSRIALDAATSLKVRYSNDARIVELKEGQAQFSVAHDPVRPFKVITGNRTIIALGTVFTVEFIDQRVHVAMMEGRVAVVPQGIVAQLPSQSTSKGETTHRDRSLQGSGPGVRPSPTQSPFTQETEADGQAGTIELAAGEELSVSKDGHTTVTPKADLEAATAWREGKVIFRTVQLNEAVRRVNRYSRVQIEIEDESLSGRRISGVFEAGDSQGFVNAVERYLPITVDRSMSDRIRLSAK